MAAPSGISWSSIASSYYRLGIYVSTSSTDTNTTVSIQVWLWTKYSLTDSNNKFYFNNNASSATTLVKSNTSLSHTVSSGSGWSTSNQTKIGSYSYSYTRTTSAQTIYCAAKMTNIGSNESSVSHSKSYTIPALASYTISYNANGGSGAPSSQTKWYGTELTLSGTKPTRTGYSFLGWSASSSATSASYTAGSSYTANSSATLYAVWKANTYTVSYDANGGSGAPSDQTKTYGVPLTISTTEPTREDYTFLGWGVSSSSTTVAYSAGASYTNNAPITLYAIWELSYIAPRITDVSVTRCTSAGVASDDGTYCLTIFTWTTDLAVSSIVIRWKKVSDTTWTSATVSASGTSGTVSEIVGSNSISTESTYNVEIIVTDTRGSHSVAKTLAAKLYTIDCLKGGKGVAFGKPAETEDLFDVNFNAKFRKQITGVEAEFTDVTATGDLSVDGSIVSVDAEFTNITASGVINTPQATINTLYDSYGTKLTNGLSIYTTAGIDPDTTLEHLILTHINTPNATYMYIKTDFYGSKSETSNRMQTAFPYNREGPPYYRYYYGGAWTSWVNMTVNQNGASTMEKISYVLASGSTISVATGDVSSTPSNWTVDEDGFYGVAAFVTWPANNSGMRQIMVRVLNSDGTVLYDIANDRRYAGASAAIAQNIAGYGRLYAGQEVRFMIRQNSGSALAVPTARFNIVKIGL